MQSLPMGRRIFPRRSVLGREDGIAMLTVLMLTVILTVIGIAAITTTTMDFRLAGGERTRETSVNVAEACLSSGIQIIQQTIANAAIPAALLQNGLNPQINAIPLQNEIMHQSNQNPDTADPTNPNFNPALVNATLTINGGIAAGGYTAFMDIDFLYTEPVPGSGLQFAAGYEGTGAGCAAGGCQNVYRIDCYAQNSAGIIAHISAVYACLINGDCQRKIG